MSGDLIVGIDLGTTNSEIAFVRDRRPEVLTLDDDGIVPSCVGVTSDGRMVVGREARNQLVVAPDRTQASIKRRMGSADRVTMAGQEYAPHEVSAFILRALKERAERVLGEPIGKAVITVPAYFTDAQRTATREAGEIAGLEVVRILNEPTAAALAYDATFEGRRRILVFDLGGGTFDVSVVSIEDGVVEVLATAGDNQLGGDDFDTLIVERLIEHLAAEHGIVVGEDLALRARLRHAAEAAKIALSTAPVARVTEDHIATVDGEPRHLDYELTRAEFEDMIEELLAGTMSAVTRALQDASLRPADIDRVVLVGGSTRIPLISELLRRRLGREPHGEVDPDLTVALGAAIQAAREMGKEIDSLLIDITPYTFGTSAVGILGGVEVPDRYCPLIHRNTKLPAMRTEIFSTMSERQSGVDIEVYQGESPLAPDNQLVGTFKMRDLNEDPGAYEKGILLTYRLSVDGVLDIHAVERASGREVRGVIDNAIGRSSEATLTASKERVDRAWGPRDEVSSEAPETPDDDSAWPAETRDTLRRARAALDAAQDEDRADLTRLIAVATDAYADNDAKTATAAVSEIDEILFYIE